MTLAFRIFGSTCICLATLTACVKSPERAVVPPGGQGMVMDLTNFNRGQCALTGPGMSVENLDILRGDYFRASGNVLGSTLRCTMANGQKVSTISHRQLFDAQYNYAALVVEPILGVGEVKVLGYNDGPGGKVDVNGTLVFTED